MKTILAGLALIAMACGGVAWWRVSGTSADSALLREATVQRGDLRVVLSGTGTLEPEEVVDVGAQVAGIIRQFGQAPGTTQTIDYGSVVEPGTMLAKIDDALYREEVELARADLTQAKSRKLQAESGIHQARANLQRAKAELDQNQSRWEQAERNRVRAEQLQATNSVSAQELETTQSNAIQAAAAVAVSRAAIAQAEASLETAQAAVLEADAAVIRAQAMLRKAETNLGYTTIASPIRGVIIDRRVNIGQTVVASLNAPSLFLIAKDLRRLQVWASVNEADIGQVRVGQPVAFRVDARPDRDFAGTVSQIRLNASMNQNVVTYTVVITVDNADGQLMPYLTANLEFEVEVRNDVLLVPAGALRWQPRPELIHPAVRDTQAASSAHASTTSERGTLWLADGGYVRPLAVAVGASDGVHTEVSGERVQPGLTIIVGETRRSALGATTVNPFAPQLVAPKKARAE